MELRDPRRALLRATAVGTVLQLVMVLTGHFSPAIASLFAFGGMAISLCAGLLFSRWAAPPRARAVAGGAIAGATCAAVGIAVSVLLGDVPPSLLLFGTASSAATGAIGGVLGRPRRAVAVAATAFLFLLPSAGEVMAQSLAEGWRAVADEGSVESINLEAMAPGWHIWPGPAARMYRPGDTVGNRFRVDFEAHVFAGSAGGYGIFFGNPSIEEGRADFFEILLDGEGRMRLGHDAGTAYHEVIAWTPHEPIARPAPGAPANNRMTIEVSEDELKVTVNGVELTSFDPPLYANFSGTVGLRFLDGTSAHVTLLDVEDLGR